MISNSRLTAMLVIATLAVPAHSRGNVALAQPAPSVSSSPAPSEGPSAEPSSTVTQTAEIANAADLKAYLVANVGKTTPFDASTPASKPAFLSSISFGSHGVAGFNAVMFEDQLTEPQRLAILTLFGQQGDLAGYRPAHELSDADRRKVRRIAEAAAPGSHGPDAIERAYAAFESAQPSMPLTQAQLLGLVRKNYAAKLAAFQRSASLATSTDGDTIDLYRGAHDAAFYTDDLPYARSMLLDFDELERRGLVTSRDDEDMFGILLSERLFPEAHAFAAKHTDVDGAVPAFVDETNAATHGPTQLVLSGDAKRLLRRSVDFSKPAQVIVVSSPFCHFCQGAVRDIAKVTELQRLMQHYSHWLIPQEGAAIPFAAVRQWNAEHPAETMTLVYRQTEWSMFDAWNTPTFYFFKKSRLVAKMSGWPPEGRVAELERALRDIGAN